MLIDYIEAAMHHAKYELLADREGFAGQIPGFRGLIGHGHTLEGCREDLHGALQSWLLVKLRHGDRDLPVVDGINLIASKARPKGGKKYSVIGVQRGESRQQTHRSLQLTFLTQLDPTPRHSEAKGFA